MSFLHPHPWVTQQWVPYAETLAGNARFRIRQAVDELGYDEVLARAHAWTRTAAIDDPHAIAQFADSLDQEIHFLREEERRRREEEQRIALERLRRRNAAASLLLDPD